MQRTDRFETATLAGNQPGVAKIRVNVTPQGNKLYYATNELTGAATPQPRDSQGYPRGIEAATPATNINIPQNVRKVNAAGDSHPASVESIRQTYEKLIAEQQAANAENLAAANRVRDLTDVYRENVQTKGAGADTVSAQQVENSAGQGYNGIDTLEKLYDEAVHSKGTEGAGDAPTKPYTTSRPKYGKTQVDDVWNNYKDPTTGKAPDPAGGSISWDKTKPRQGQWDMGHIPEEKYSDMRDRYIRGEISQQEFLGWYRNPANYRPELPSTNRSHKYE
ncbi:HNH/ENDO VII family nuclease [Oscillospiraceae bacterium CM]|nr:HNH/ENDO VII family nuclease [Oscillospiraceae bacterium CM]